MNEENQIENQNETAELTKKLKWYEQKYGHYYETKGLKNWKNLFRKPTLMEWTLLVMLILVLFGAWAYNEDTKKCRKTLENLPLEVCEACREFQTNKHLYESESGIGFDLENISFINDSEVGEE